MSDTTTTFGPGAIITNGSQAMRLEERVERDPRWQAAGWRGVNVALEQFGGNPGMSQFVPDYLLSSWRELPMDWSPVIGGGLEERYVWSADYRHLRRELREAGTSPHGDTWWTDSFGNWHVYVKDRQGGEICAARRFIFDAITEHSGCTVGLNRYVMENVTRAPESEQDRPGFTLFRELPARSDSGKNPTGAAERL